MTLSIEVIWDQFTEPPDLLLRYKMPLTVVSILLLTGQTFPSVLICQEESNQEYNLLNYTFLIIKWLWSSIIIF